MSVSVSVSVCVTWLIFACCIHLLCYRLAFAYLEQFSTSAPNLSTAVSLVCLLSILADQSQTSELKPLIGEATVPHLIESHYYILTNMIVCLGTMATSVLKRDWPDILKEKSSRLSEWILPLVK